MKKVDVVVVGGGPAGATAAATCARSGLQTLLIERANFPRDKVCGDCVNPGCWEVFDRLGCSAEIAGLPSALLRWVEFVNIRGSRIRFSLPADGRGERGIRRRDLDHALLQHAKRCGAEVWEGEPVTRVGIGWQVETTARSVSAAFLIAADGRNSTVARLLQHYPRTNPDRVALQTHVNTESEPYVALELCPEGYIGLATIGENLLNICLVCRPARVERLRAAANRRFGLGQEHRWQTIAPLTRYPLSSNLPNLLYAGDTARVVEPFTGEGILYALQSGELAAHCVAESIRTGAETHRLYWPQHRRLYQNRLWINHLARLSVLHPRLASLVLAALKVNSLPLRYLTKKVVRA
jgi:menaquinone-9 beta-reductase